MKFQITNGIDLNHVIPAQAGIHTTGRDRVMDSRLRGNDGNVVYSGQQRALVRTRKLLQVMTNSRSILIRHTRESGYPYDV